MGYDQFIHCLASGSYGQVFRLEAKRISIVGFTRKEHHAKRQVRIVPLFPEIEREFFTLHLEAEEGAKEH